MMRAGIRLARYIMAIAGIVALFAAGTANAGPIFWDEFDRADSNTVGNGWIELEDDSNDVRVRDGGLQLKGSDIAAVLLQFSLADFPTAKHIQLGFSWSASYNTESADSLSVHWAFDLDDDFDDDLDDDFNENGDWTTAWTQDLGGSDLVSVLDLSLADIPKGAKTFSLLFLTDLSSSKEKVFIDNVDIRNPHLVPEPSATILLGIGLISLVGYGWVRRKQEAVSDNS